MKRIQPGSLALAAVLLLACSAAGAHNSNAKPKPKLGFAVPVATISAGDVSGEPGQTVRIPIRIGASARQIAALDLIVAVTPGRGQPLPTFPSSPDLQLNPDLEEPLAVVNDLGDGRLHLALTGASGVNGPAQLLSVPVIIPETADPGATYRVDLSGAAVNSSAQNVRVAFESGKIRVARPKPPSSDTVLALIEDAEVRAGEVVLVDVLVSKSAKDIQGARIDLGFGAPTPSGAPNLLPAGDPVAGGVFGRDALVVSDKTATGIGIAIAQADSGKGPGVLVRVPLKVPEAAEVGTSYPLTLAVSLVRKGVEAPVTATGATLLVVPNQRHGDVDGNGEVNLRDAISLLAHLLSGEEPSEELLFAGDLNGDGRLSLLDAIDLLKRLAGLKPLHD